MPNRLANESSPYLLQHQDNPVDWYAWGPEALARASAEDKPIFLSIGYSACHWCHVMEHESFENEEIAAELNARFVCIKVDREERPDLDQIYMNAVQLMTHRGGWPMSVFLTPDLQPFYGGTYWPPERRMGMPGFRDVVVAVADAWENRREQAVQQAAEITERIREDPLLQLPAGELGAGLIQEAATKLENIFDFTHGGFGGAPKFPHAMDLQLLMRVFRDRRQDGVLEMVTKTLDKMHQGGIYDHLGGGFARYSVDAMWLVPHFEKMLYDNALLAGAYLDGYRLTGNPQYRRVVEETLGYVLRDMTDPHGGFHSSEDADSEGQEGKFYVWTPDEVQAVLGPELAEKFCYVYDVSQSGNFEGKSILNLPKSLEQCAALRGWDLQGLEAELATAREQLLAVRDQRVRPGKDDKVLVSWNALMIDSLARAAGVFGSTTYRDAATRAAAFILREMQGENGRLLHCWRAGRASLQAYLDDYVYLINALVSLYELSFDEAWIEHAVRLADDVMEHFHDEQQGGFFYTANDHEQLIARTKDFQDSSVPSGNAMAAAALTRLAALTGRQSYRAAARKTLELGSGLMRRAPSAAGQLLIASHMQLAPFTEVVILGDSEQAEARQALHALRARYVPNCVLVLRDPSSPGARAASLDPIFAGKEPVSETTVFLCQDFACQQPLHELPEILAAVETL